MAKGGSGDVLTGLIAALAAQLPLKTAAPLAVYVHGLAGDLCRRELSEYSIAASDIIDAIPKAFVTLEKLRQQIP
jgi:NAD(P)H-hydrate epimerase